MMHSHTNTPGCLEALINKTTVRSLLRLRPQNVHILLVLLLGLWARLGQAKVCPHGNDDVSDPDCKKCYKAKYDQYLEDTGQNLICSHGNKLATCHQKINKGPGHMHGASCQAFYSRNMFNHFKIACQKCGLCNPSCEFIWHNGSDGNHQYHCKCGGSNGQSQSRRGRSRYGNRRRLQRCSHGIKTYLKCRECDENGNGRTCDVGYLDRKYKNAGYEERASHYPRKRSGNNDCPHLTSDQRFQWRHLFRGPKGLDGFGQDGCPECCSPSSKKYKCGRCKLRSDQSPGTCQFATHHQWKECDAQNDNGRQSPRDPRARYQPSNCNNCNNCTDCFDRDPNLGACEAVAPPSLNFDDDFARPSRKKKSAPKASEQKGWLGGWFGRRLAEDDVTLRRLAEDNVNSLTAFCAWALMLLIVVVVYTLTKMGKRSAMQRRHLSKTQVAF